MKIKNQKTKSEKDDEPEEEEDEENPWVGIWDEVKRRQKEKRNALIAEIQKSGESEEVADVEAYKSLLPLYRKELTNVLLEDLKWLRTLEIERNPSIEK